jgi:hypothetical protein
MYQCPTCQSVDHLEVAISTWAKLIQPTDAPEDFQTDLDDASQHDHEWDSNAVMKCTNPACSDSHETRIVAEFKRAPEAI